MCDCVVRWLVCFWHVDAHAIKQNIDMNKKQHVSINFDFYVAKVNTHTLTHTHKQIKTNKTENWIIRLDSRVQNRSQQYQLNDPETFYAYPCACELGGCRHQRQRRATSGELERLFFREIQIPSTSVAAAWPLELPSPGQSDPIFLLQKRDAFDDDVLLHFLECVQWYFPVRRLYLRSF